MGNPTLGMILSDARKLVASKQASTKQAIEAPKNIAGTSPESMPGSEHDSKVPDEAKQPQKYVKDETMVPNSGLSNAGAGKPELTMAGALDADQAAEVPKKKPLDTDDANAKEASDATAGLANDILSLIRTAQKQAAAPAPVATPAPAPEKQAAAPAPKAAAPKAPAAAPEKKAGELNMELTTDVMAKVAALILSTEEGAEFAEKVLAKQAGAEMATETLAFLAQQSELAEKQAAFEAGQRDAQAMIDQQIFQAGVAHAQKQAQAQTFHKLGQAAADASMADMMGGAGGADGAAPAPAPGGDEGGEGGDISIEDITAALEALVQEGKVQPEEAQAVLQYLTEGGEAGAGAAPEGGEGAAAEPAAAPAAAAPEGADVNKAASASNLLTAIRQLKAQK